MQFLTDWLVVFSVGCLAVTSPGPNLAITLRNSLAYSRQSGIYTALGLAAGNLVHTTYCLLGIGLVISQSILLFSALKWAGAAYLIYVGCQALRSQKSAAITSARSTQAISRITAVQMGFLTNLLNPKVTLFFLALFTQIIQPETPLWVQVIYGLTIVALEFTWFALVSLLVSQKAVKQQFQAVSHRLERGMGIMLIALGLRLALAQNSN
ncbi:LysE family transporter [Leptolyngbya sp. FACHB-261]|uniref:LysE family transporter n=1 Tax=Leptolyngbya sp. FACHB-261 TaxID=2692806 RepID=UPI001685A8C6|nr:LysE family transporter [Leptolyngbya sp. FACHB-261]MBD2102755.1 LysE family transporter [Leptolyngbya sp. FACHB-261]